MASLLCEKTARVILSAVLFVGGLLFILALGGPVVLGLVPAAGAEHSVPLSCPQLNPDLKDGLAGYCKACVRRGSRRTPSTLAAYHLRWQRANRDKQRAHNRRYRARKADDPEYRERERARHRAL